MRSLLALAAFVLAASADADILNVPGDFATIQAALDAAQDGDEIVLAPGTYVVDWPLQTVTSFPFRILDDVTLRSIDPDDTAVTASTNVHVDWAFMFEQVPAQLELAGITLTGDGCDEFGQSFGRLAFRKCVIDGGSGAEQFEIRMDGTSLELIDTHLTGQIADMLDVRVDEFIVDGCTFGPRTGVYEFSSMNPDMLRLSNMSIVDTGTNQDGSIRWPIVESVIMTNMSFVRSPVPPSSRTTAEVYNCRFEEVHVDSRGLFNVDVLIAEDSDFVGLVSSSGPGRLVDARNLTLRHCRVERCGGFAVVLARDTGLLQDSDFIDNLARYATVEGLGAMTIERCRFVGNNTAADPQFSTIATISLREASDTASAIRDSEFLGNGIASGNSTLLDCSHALSYTPEGSLTIERCTFAGNRARVLKSPLFGPNDTPFAMFTDSVFVGNESNNLGFGNAVFLGCTFAGNGSGLGSVWSFFGDSGEVANCIVNHDDPQPFIGTVAVSNSVLSAPIPGATNSTTLDPLFVLQPSNGGDGWGDDPATPNIDESLNDDFGDLRLQPASPAIDAGTNDFFTPGDLDLDSNPRLADDPGIPGNTVDIGAYEFQGTTCLADVNQDGQLSPNDFNAWILAFNANSPLADQNRDGEVRQNDFNAWILNFNRGC